MKHGKNEWWLIWISIEWQYHGIMGYTGTHVYVYIYIIEIYPPEKLTVCKLVNHRAQLVLFRYMTDGRFSSQFLVISNGMWFKRSQFKFNHWVSWIHMWDIPNWDYYSQYIESHKMFEATNQYIDLSLTIINHQENHQENPQENLY